MNITPRYSKLALAAIAILVLGACDRPPAAEPDSSDLGATLPVAFLGVNVIPMDTDRVLGNQTVIVSDGRIASVDPASEAEIPDGAVLVDGEGKYLLPGLAEMHGHIPPPDQPAELVESVLFMYVANGITTVRGMLGYDGQLELRDRANTGDLIAPNLYLAGPSFNEDSVESPEQATGKVRAQVEEGWDLLKVHPGLTMAEYDAMATTANELGIPFGGHVPADVGIAHAIDMGQQTIDHLDGYIEFLNGGEGPLDPARLAAIVERTRSAGAWVVPTMALWETIMGTPSVEELSAYVELQYMPSPTRDQWSRQHVARLSAPGFDPDVARTIVDNRMIILKALSDAGVRVLMGTDAPQQFSVPGFSIHRELSIMADAGMSPYEILRSGTTNVGLYFRERDTFGTVMAGGRADLLLVDDNPLEDIGNLEHRSGVMVRGLWLPEQAIQERLASIAASYQ